MGNTYSEKLCYALGVINGLQISHSDPDRQAQIVINALPLKSEIVKSQIKNDLKAGNYALAKTRLTFSVV